MSSTSKNEKMLSFHEKSVTVSRFTDNKKPKFSLFGLLVLIGAVVGGASMPPFINMYGDISTFIKNLWRCQLNFLISIPFVIHLIASEPETIDYGYIFS
jgi:hypothetical protein